MRYLGAPADTLRAYESSVASDLISFSLHADRHLAPVGGLAFRLTGEQVEHLRDELSAWIDRKAAAFAAHGTSV